MAENLPVLDWRPRFDERSRAFRVAAPAAPKLRKATWRHGPVLDQKSEGACVGFAAAQNLQSTKRPQQLGDGNEVARAVYHGAQKIDEWEGEDYSGTSVLAGMKYLHDTGRVLRYNWAFGSNDALYALSWRGPVQVGVWWYSGMWDTDTAGFLHVTGQRVGGHSTLLSAIDPAGQFVTITNSWGPGWGRNGQAKLSFADLRRLLDDEAGEAVTVVKPVSR